jgi:hypothetical protein
VASTYPCPPFMVEIHSGQTPSLYGRNELGLKGRFEENRNVDEERVQPDVWSMGPSKTHHHHPHMCIGIKMQRFSKG